MSEKCPVCSVKKPGLCIHEKMMLGMLGMAVVAAVLILVLR